MEQLQEHTQQAGKKPPAALVVASQHAWHLWHRTDAGRHVSGPGFSPACCAYCSYLTRRPHCYLPQFVYPGASASTPVKVFRDIRLHLCCVVCFTENEEGGWGVLKGDSTLVRGQTDGLCVGYLQPGGGWGNLAVVAEVRSQGSRAKAPQNVIKIKCKRRLRGGFCRWCAQESCHFYAVSLIHSLYQFVIQGEEAWPARLIRPRAEKLAFFFLFFPERPEERMNS